MTNYRGLCIFQKWEELKKSVGIESCIIIGEVNWILAMKERSHAEVQIYWKNETHSIEIGTLIIIGGSARADCDETDEKPLIKGYEFNFANITGTCEL